VADKDFVSRKNQKKKKKRRFFPSVQAGIEWIEEGERVSALRLVFLYSLVPLNLTSTLTRSHSTILLAITRMLSFALTVGVICSSSANPSPPAKLATAFTAHFRLHSASPYAHGSYFDGEYVIDVANGVKRETGLNWEGVGCDNEDR
jgi:hypothetical protein